MKSPTCADRLRLEKHRSRYLEERGYHQHGVGNNGVFLIPKGDGWVYQCIVSDGGGWEHVSVVMVGHPEERSPTWAEMCAVKAMFWRPDECVVQYHPPKADYVNLHPHALHLWKPVEGEMPRPPKWMVG